MKNKGGRQLIIKPHDTIAELKDALKRSQDEAYRVRLRAIIKAKENKKRNTISKELSVSVCAISNWVTKYNEKGKNGLATRLGGRPKGDPKWKEEPFKALTKKIDEGGYWSIPKMQKWLAENFSLQIPEQTVWYRMDQLGYSYKSARPHPVKGNKEKQEVFKKGASLRS